MPDSQLRTIDVTDKTEKCYRDLIHLYSSQKKQQCDASNAWVPEPKSTLDKIMEPWQKLDPKTQSDIVDVATMLGNYVFTGDIAIPAQVLIDLPDRTSVILKYSQGQNGQQYLIEYTYTFGD
jgi:hypothetical protein